MIPSAESSAVLPTLGLLGGTFAPVHHGHLRLAIEARERLKLDQVRLLPAALPPHRPTPGVLPERRLHWVQLAVAGIDGLVADGRELERSGASYTIDTLRELRAEHPGVSLCLLLGMDAVEALHTWKRAEDIPALANVVVFNRPGHPGALAEILQRHWSAFRVSPPEALGRQKAGAWVFCEAPLLQISSTYVRQRLSAGGSLHGLIPQAVLQSFTPEDRRALAS